MYFVYKVWTYDVWGNAKDGYDVNDRFPRGEIKLKAKKVIYSKGKPNEFVFHKITNRQLNRAIGLRGVSWYGDQNYSMYCERNRDGRPICEVEFLRMEDKYGKELTSSRTLS